MIRFATDINPDEMGAFIRQMKREKMTMRAFAISLSIACTVWVSAALTLLAYSREVAVLLLEWAQ